MHRWSENLWNFGLGNLATLDAGRVRPLLVCLPTVDVLAIMNNAKMRCSDSARSVYIHQPKSEQEGSSSSIRSVLSASQAAAAESRSTTTIRVT